MKCGQNWWRWVNKEFAVVSHDPERLELVRKELKVVVRVKEQDSSILPLTPLCPAGQPGGKRWWERNGAKIGSEPGEWKYLMHSCCSLPPFQLSSESKHSLETLSRCVRPSAILFGAKWHRACTVLRQQTDLSSMLPSSDKLGG